MRKKETITRILPNIERAALAGIYLHRPCPTVNMEGKSAEEATLSACIPFGDLGHAPYAFETNCYYA